MAEARLGVDPIAFEGENFDVNPAKPSVQISFEDRGTVIFIPKMSDLWRNFVRRVKQMITKTSVAFQPLPVPVVGGLIAGFVTSVLYSKNSHWWKSTGFVDFLWKVDSRLGFAANWPKSVKITNLALTTAVVSLYSFAVAQRFLLRRLLSYHGWLFEGAKGRSILTKIWYVSLNYLYIHRIHETLYAYQPCLPHLPLPALKDTCARYFETVEPLMDAEETAAHKAEMEAFLNNEGPTLQRLLWLKWLISENWISDWWLQAIYLRSRDSLMINSNWFGITMSYFVPSTDQAVRAASLCYILTRIQRQLENGNFEPQMVRGLVPLCMDQYQYVFGTTRIPRHTCDHLQKFEYSESRHMVLIHKGVFYRIPLFSPVSRKPYTPLQFYETFAAILRSDAQTTDAQYEADAARLLPVLTAMNRDKWATVREKEFLLDHNNRKMLGVVERAAWILNIDHQPEPKDWEEEGMRNFVGNGCNRWADKSCQWVIHTGGRVGVHGEHAWGDAPVIAHINEIVAVEEYKDATIDAATGKIKRLPEDDEIAKNYPGDACHPTQLRFNVPKSLAETVLEARDEVRRQIADVSVKIQRFGDFGKKLMSKQIKVSPDAFIQMSLQLAYFRDQGHFDQTYESSMTRFFKLGRTETIRSLSKESCAFVKAFEDPTVPVADKYKAFVNACERHQAYSHRAMCGEGVDRHLFALYIISIVRGIESPFLKTALTARKWKLSTSQIPPRQLADSSYAGIPAERPLESPNGGFGPVADDGYGVCYMVRDDNVYFTCSSRPSKANTDSVRMQGRIRQALLDIRDVFAPYCAEQDALKPKPKK